MVKSLTWVATCVFLLPIPIPAQVSEWSLEPTLTIGARIDDPPLTWVDDIAADGDSVFVLQSQTDEVLVFDQTGEHITTIGRTGRGPGEFTAPTQIGYDRRGLWIADRAESRVTIFESRTEFNTITARVSNTGLRSFSVAGPLSNGMVLGELLAPDAMIAAGTARANYLVSYDPGSARLDTIATLLRQGTMLSMETERSRISMRQPVYRGAFHELGPNGESVIVLEQEPASSRGASLFRVTWLDVDGDTLRSKVYRRSPHRLTDAHREALVSDLAATLFQRGSFSSLRAAERAVAETLYLPDTLPPVSDVFVSRDSAVWVRHEEHSGDNVQYTVVSSDGGLEGVLQVPRAITLYDSTGETVWARHVDNNQVNTVVRYRLTRDR